MERKAGNETGTRRIRQMTLGGPGGYNQRQYLNIRIADKKSLHSKTKCPSKLYDDHTGLQNIFIFYMTVLEETFLSHAPCF